MIDEMEIERMLRLSSPKVLAIYEAVNGLMEEGRDIYSMKISEITARAGIGKGTAYEYFSTKEELLGKAVFYQLHQGLVQMTAKAMKASAFREQIYAVLEDVEQNYRKRRMLFRYLCYYMLETWGKEVGCCPPPTGNSLLAEVIRHMKRQGEKEGLIKEQPEFFVAETLLSQFAGFCLYISAKEGVAANVSVEEMKAFVYESIVKSLGRSTAPA